MTNWHDVPCTCQVTLDFGAMGKITSVKIAVLKQVDDTGSISAAARALGITYKHAWEIVDDLNQLFGCSLVEGQTGGKQGGGSRLTTQGRIVVAQLGQLERQANARSLKSLKTLQQQLTGKQTQRSVK